MGHLVATTITEYKSVPVYCSFLELATTTHPLAAGSLLTGPRSATLLYPIKNLILLAAEGCHLF